MKIFINGKATETNRSIVSDALKDAGIWLNVPCGGKGLCGKCTVLIENAAQPDDRSAALLNSEQLEKGVRLACKTALFEGIRIAAKEKAEAIISVDGRKTGYSFDPMLTARVIELPMASLDDQRDDAVRLQEALSCEKFGWNALKKLPALLNEHDRRVEAVCYGNELLDVRPVGHKLLGLAVDIGTTTVAAYLIDLHTGACIATASGLNPQKAMGDDVITRCDYAAHGGLQELQSSIVNGINKLLAQMCARTDSELNDVYLCEAVGNTVMMHILMDIAPEQIARAPFAPVFTQSVCVKAEEIGLQIASEGLLCTLPCVAGYVGADTVSAMVAAEIKNDETALLLDIGTNGEIVLKVNGQYYACSAAAGPAFEGAHIRYGMGGVAGAINRVKIEKEGVQFTVIGDVPAQGICGSGLMDAIAGCVESGVIEDTGAIDEDAAEKFAFELVTDEGILLDAEHDILLTRKDIREVQLAKSAIASGVQVLLKKAGSSVDKVEKVYLAGGFGTYMDKYSACRIGLLPAQTEERTLSIGNAAGAGACAALISKQAVLDAETLSKKIQYIELSSSSEFQDEFMDNMFFSND